MMVGWTLVLDEPDRKEFDFTGDDGLVEHVVYVRVVDESWLQFSACPKCGSVNACVCDRSGRDER